MQSVPEGYGSNTTNVPSATGDVLVVRIGYAVMPTDRYIRVVRGWSGLRSSSPLLPFGATPSRVPKQRGRASLSIAFYQLAIA